MANPYSHPFLKRENTMYLSTIGTVLIRKGNKIFRNINHQIENLVF